MSNPLVECIPNYSEARRPEVVQEIINTISSVSGVHVLDHHSDLDHNRTVVTFVGTPEAAEEAAYQSIAIAAKLIDLNQHTGEHPRIGATDVVPFVPLKDITMVECVEIARRLGQRVADQLSIPVYLYEEAATQPDRHNLENIRHGQYEGLKTVIASDPARKPDFGPSKLGSAGATVRGARAPLIASNVYLTTDDITIAQKIAKSMRNSSGGYRFIKALGLLVDGRAQVSMNMTNFHQTPIYRVVESIRREAQRYGVSIHHSELVGLTPQESLIDSAVWYLQLDGFKGEQILESRLYTAQQEQTLEEIGKTDFVDDLASGTPTPGGGSASAYSGAMAAALVCMVARLTIGKKKYADVEAQMWNILNRAELLQKELKRAVQDDASSFEDLLTAMRLPKDTPENIEKRDGEIVKATLNAAGIPLTVCEKALNVMRLAIEAASAGNLNALSDAGSAFSLASAAFKGASMNVQINLKGIEQSDEKQLLLNQLDEFKQDLATLEDQIRQVMDQRGGITL
jgi:glutamate formiminotransferase / formiminotetrahydrofolate cyclodeaminase